MRVTTFSMYIFSLLCLLPSVASAELLAGAAKTDISPVQMPVIVNGSMTQRTTDQLTTRIHARALVLRDESETIAICVVDACILSRTLCDEAKAIVSSRSNIAADRILISATHTHTAPSSIAALGTDLDENYVPLLRQKIAEAILAAEANLEAAQVGWGSTVAPDFTALRRWVRRPDRLAEDPFGNPTVRATMHAARNPDDAIGPTGPEDPELSVISLQSTKGHPIATLANFSMHYFGGQQGISADYFGLYCDLLEQHMRETSPAVQDSQTESARSPIAIMSHGCSGDIWRKDYLSSKEISEGTIEQYSLGLVERTKVALASVSYDDADLAMEQVELSMKYRVPDRQRLDWAQRVVQEMGDRLPKTQPEIYAREQVFLDNMQSTKILLQAIRIGDIAIATTPNETYALTGLKLKLQSPLEQTMVIELANGGEGYIPPPEQHRLGGYNTWPARSAGLEESAEPRIAAANLSLLETVTGQPRKRYRPDLIQTTQQLLNEKPIALWTLDEFAPPLAHDVTGNHMAVYEPDILFFLDGPASEPITATGEPTNPCVHFAGGRLRTELPQLADRFSVSLSLWNGMPLGSRDVLGWFLSNDFDNAVSQSGLHLGLNRDGKLVLLIGDTDATSTATTSTQAVNAKRVTGSTKIDRWSWAEVLLVHAEDEIKVYLNQSDKPEIVLQTPQRDHRCSTWFFGGRSDGQDGWEGRLDDIAVFDRPLR